MIWETSPFGSKWHNVFWKWSECCSGERIHIYESIHDDAIFQTGQPGPAVATVFGFQVCIYENIPYGASHVLVSFTNPLAAGSEAGNLSTHVSALVFEFVIHIQNVTSIFTIGLRI